MPRSEEEEAAKILLCNLESTWHAADAARHAAHAVAENVGLMVYLNEEDDDKKLAAYLREVGRLASNIENAADQIMAEVTAFKGT
jgi:hypothetical protein